MTFAELIIWKSVESDFYYWLDVLASSIWGVNQEPKLVDMDNLEEWQQLQAKVMCGRTMENVRR